jgi:hypothetical protein
MCNVQFILSLFAPKLKALEKQENNEYHYRPKQKILNVVEMKDTNLFLCEIEIHSLYFEFNSNSTIGSNAQVQKKMNQSDECIQASSKFQLREEEEIPSPSPPSITTTTTSATTTINQNRPSPYYQENNHKK